MNQFTRINPMTGEEASSAPAMKAGEMAAVAARADAAFPAWAAMGPNARRAVLMKAAAALEARADAFVEAMMGEIGATKGWAMFNLGLAAGMVREAAALTTQIGGEVIPSDKPGCLAMALKEPVGVILGIAPWNAPIILGVRAIAVPLACGNSVILKASETCPRTHALIIEAFAEAGFPDGVVNVVTNAPEDAAKRTSHREDKVRFAEAWFAFDEHMPPGKERSEDLVEHDILAKEDLADFVADGGNASDRLFKRRRDCDRGIGFHVGWLVHVRRAMAIFCKS
jgi:acyl-CoA reductase-like NAD-dependent aldehyde dehydrogenase